MQIYPSRSKAKQKEKCAMQRQSTKKQEEEECAICCVPVNGWVRASVWVKLCVLEKGRGEPAVLRKNWNIQWRQLFNCWMGTEWWCVTSSNKILSYEMQQTNDVALCETLLTNKREWTEKGL